MPTASAASALLFAGSERGGRNDMGLTRTRFESQEVIAERRSVRCDLRSGTHRTVAVGDGSYESGTPLEVEQDELDESQGEARRRTR